MRTAGKSLAQVMGVSLLAVLIGMGCHSTSERSTTKPTKQDRAAAKSVKEALATDSIFKYPDVSVKAQKGGVELSGFVFSPSQRNRAEQLATQAAQGEQVINNIEFRGSPTGRATILDPLGGETGRVMLETNPPAPAQP